MKDFWAEELQNQRKSKVRKIILLVIILIIILAILATIVVYLVNSEFRKWCDENVIKKEIQQDDAKYIDIDMDDNVEVYAYDTSAISYTVDSQKEDHAFDITIKLSVIIPV